MYKSDDNSNDSTYDTIRIIAGSIIGLIGLYLIFCAFTGGSDIVGVGLTNNGIQFIDNSDFEIIENTISSRRENELYFISGKVKQKKEDSFDGIFITFTMYDSNNKRVRSTYVNTSNYLGDKIWEFTAIGNDADNIVTNYKLKSIYGY